MALNRSDLIIEIAKRTKTTSQQLTRREVEHVIDIMLDIFEDQLTQPDGGIRLGELGLLGVQERRLGPSKAQGTLIHPNTGEKIKSPSRIQHRINFSPTRRLREKLKQRIPLFKYEG
ncbi:MAG: HU family DNA-binding protein [Chloroflexota bacterium]